MLPHDSANTRFASSIEMFSQLEGILVAGYRGIDFAPEFRVERGDNTPSKVPTHHRLRTAQRRHQLGATLHGAALTMSDLAAVEPGCLQALDPMQGATNGGLALAPIAQPGAAPAHYSACVEPQHLSASAAGSADELKEDGAGTHANTDNSDIARDRRAVVSLQRHCDICHVGRQSA
jgi:hypothetical protein